MIGCLRTRFRKQPIITLYLESENELKFYNLEAWILCINLELWLTADVLTLWRPRLNVAECGTSLASALFV